MKISLFAAAAALAIALPSASPAVAQDASAMAGTMTASDVGASPMMGVSATDYVKMAADGDMYEIASSKLAVTKTKNEGLKGFAREMITDHMQTTKTLMAALKNGDRTIAPPSKAMSAENAANVALLKKAPKGNFDQLYMQQQLAAHQKAWSLHKGYATDGTDATLKQIAATAVPVIEKHIAHLKGMMGGTAGTM
ncbi:MAG: DUF4142 domain-containing protein [Zymomonas sp.]|nr:MAG: DUF4142 domain-containing protein [Zymomonas sp.]